MESQMTEAHAVLILISLPVVLLIVAGLGHELFCRLPDYED
jgi:hypothetical protein